MDMDPLDVRQANLYQDQTALNLEMQAETNSYLLFVKAFRCDQVGCCSLLIPFFVCILKQITST